jgi:predicted XRE-type DNA-binding protein
METTATKRDFIREGEQSYKNWRDKLLADPDTRALYQEEATRKEIWLQLVEARLASGLTQKDVAERLGVSQAQVARLEKQGYDSYTLRSLQRYLSALGENFTLNISIERVAATAMRSRT